ncbi:hypothetical protein CK501_15665 [Halovibrio salipaludis]|uniref:RHS repeat-associated core domain-containing protein n=1 Tax=Halovibrio salipaludis TaxID=2032626 RepID=A0A2A2EXB7_9GAMM|nr:RHS repeat-associated core domain-containing protein [Halovibrio salipaludis]PAU77002.1 hypothetical protein CK501_15665 [Halovibrio salipaludis]
MMTGRAMAQKLATALSGLALVLVVLAANPALAYHFPWDQNHDTTEPEENEDPPGTCESDQCDPCGDESMGSPVYIPTGHFVWSDTDVGLPGRPQLGVSRTYNSHDPRDGLFGNGWSANCEVSVFETVTVDEDSGEPKKQYIVLLPNGKRYEYSVDDSGNVQTPDARYDQLVPRDDGTLRLEQPDGSYRVFESTGPLIRKVDRNGNTIHYEYDDQQRLTRMADDHGRFLELTYNAAGRVATVKDHGGRQWQYRYDDTGNLVGVTNPEGGERRYEYESYTNNADGQTYQQLVRVTDASGVDVVNVTYDRSRVTEYTQGENRYSYSHDASNQEVVKTDSTGARWTYDYNDDQVITRIAVENGDGGTDVTSYTYDDNGNRTQVNDAAGQQWSYDYDDQGRLLSETNPQGETTTYDYDGNKPWPITVTSPSGRTTGMTYDDRGNVLTTTDPMGNTVTMEWNDQGDLVTLTDALGRSTSFSYNNAGLITGVTDAEGRTRRLEYDELGRQVSLTRPGGETQRWEYDALGRVISVINGLGYSTGFSYDAVGRLQQLTDWAGNTTTFDYDQFGRRVEKHRPDGQALKYSYNAANNVVARTRPDGTRIEYDYDRKQRLQQVTLPNETYQYSYSARDRVTEVTQSSNGWTSEYDYDAAGRLVSATHNGHSIALERNTEGEVTTRTVAGETHQLQRNERGQVTAVQTPAGDYSLSYDSAGQLTQLDYPGGSASMGYNASGEYTSQQFGDSQGTAFNYARDANGRVSQRQGEGADWFYNYDDANRLSSATRGEETHDFQLDANGNRLEEGQQYDAFNKLLASADVEYEHDANGNRIRKTNTQTGAVTQYEYDARNRLTGAEHYPEEADSPAWTASYAYDAANRRIAKTVTGEIEREVEYLWFGDRLVAEYHDGASTPTKRYRYSQTGVVPLSYSDANGDYSVHSDALATPKALTNSNGTTVWSAVLGPYGQPTENQDVDGDGQQVAFNLRFPGQYHDRETGLHYNRNRTYDPVTGRYLQSDPIGLGGGANAYRYANANPVNLADPNGTIACGGLCIGAAVLGAADMALSVYDAYQTYNTLSDECASAGDKSMAVAALGAGLVLPGSYGWVDDAAEGVARKVDLDHPGSYTNIHASGKTYVGKGSRKRSQASGRREANRNNDPHVATDWTPANSSREAYKQESRRLDAEGGPNSSTNYNRIEQPGKRYRQQDGEL